VRRASSRTVNRAAVPSARWPSRLRSGSTSARRMRSRTAAAPSARRRPMWPAAGRGADPARSARNAFRRATAPRASALPAAATLSTCPGTPFPRSSTLERGYA
jgi:hypothetical protein